MCPCFPVPFNACFLWVTAWHSETHTPKDFQEDLDQLPGQFLNSCLGDASGSFKLRKLWLDLIGTCHAKALWPGSSAGSHRHQAGTCCEWQEPSRWRQTLSALLDCRHLWLKDPISVDTRLTFSASPQAPTVPWKKFAKRESQKGLFPQVPPSRSPKSPRNSVVVADFFQSQPMAEVDLDQTPLSSETLSSIANARTIFLSITWMELKETCKGWVKIENLYC